MLIQNIQRLLQKWVQTAESHSLSLFSSITMSILSDDLKVASNMNTPNKAKVGRYTVVCINYNIDQSTGESRSPVLVGWSNLVSRMFVKSCI